MARLNQWNFIGNLTKDPEIRKLEDGTPVGTLRVAVNSYKKDDETLYVDVTVWRKKAEVCGQYLKKGDAVFVSGTLRLHKWNDKEGKEHTDLRVEANEVQFFTTKKDVTEEIEETPPF